MYVVDLRFTAQIQYSATLQVYHDNLTFSLTREVPEECDGNLTLVVESNFKDNKSQSDSLVFTAQN